MIGCEKTLKPNSYSWIGHKKVFYRPFGITCQGVYLCGENKSFLETNSEGNQEPAACEGRGIKLPLVTRVWPEAKRSNPEYGEMRVKPHGGQKRFYVQVFF